MIRITRAQDVSIDAFRTAQPALNPEVERIAAEIIEAVKRDGDRAVRLYTEKFDRSAVEGLKVTAAEFDEAEKAVSPELIRSFRKAAENIRAYHTRQLREGYRIESTPGIVLGQMIRPLERVGLYVPGGTASYPSSVLMNAIPPEIAGVPERVMVTPPGRDGKIAPAILAAAKIAGVSAVYKCGGAQAIAALAYGTESIPRVDKIVGPGNAFVAAAKRRVYGVVDIDMIAGPSEVLVIADDPKKAKIIACDLLAQAEHDALSSAILITPSTALAEAVRDCLEREIPRMRRAIIAGKSIAENGRIILANDLAEAVALSNQIAPEHLELFVEDPFALLPLVKNAGSVFLGDSTPEALGDYWAGPNHTLPTGGAARFSSPLSVDDFVKKTQYLYYGQDRLKDAKSDIVRMAEAEGLYGHARSIAVRFEETP